MICPLISKIAIIIALLTTVWCNAQSLKIRSKIKRFTLQLGKTLVSPDGFTPQLAYSVNGVLEYPIIVNRGDNLIIEVVNGLDEPTSLHWHGMFQNRSNWYDGAAGVSQCPIAPGQNFTYTFAVPDQSGTFWYHSHYRAQYVKGLRGPLIVRDPVNEPYSSLYSEERIVMLTDWFHANSSDDLLNPFLQSSTGYEPLPDSGLINAKGRYNCSLLTSVDQKCDEEAPREIFTFQTGKSYRLRIINAAAHATFAFSIDGHRLKVIETDGTATVLTVVDVISISPGQRYSVIVDANAPSDTSYWMRTTFDPDNYGEYIPGVFYLETLAIVKYETSSEDIPQNYYGWEDQLPPLLPQEKESIIIADQYSIPAYNWSSSISATPDILLVFSFAFDTDDNNHSRAFVNLNDYFNTSSFQPPLSSSILQEVVQHGNETLSASMNTVFLPLFKTVQLTIYNADSMIHPFHLHGHVFQIVSSGLVDDFDPELYYSPTLQNITFTTTNSSQYAVRDTVAIPPCQVVPGTGEDCGTTAGFVIIRFYTDNPGVWLFHCHIDWHILQGLGMVLVVDEETVRQRDIPSSVKNLCPAEYQSLIRLS